MDDNQQFQDIAKEELSSEQNSAEAIENSSYEVANAADTAATDSKKPKRRPRKKFSFWLQVGAWCAAIIVLVASLIYYNVDKKSTAPAPTTPSTFTDPNNPYDFSLLAYSGKPRFTLSQHIGEVVVVNFWYTTCGPCVEEMPIFNRIANEYPQVTVVAIHSALITESPADMTGVQKFINNRQTDDGLAWKDFNITFLQDEPIGSNPSPTFSKLGGTNFYPITIIFGKDGEPAAFKPSSITYEYLKVEIEKLI